MQRVIEISQSILEIKRELQQKRTQLYSDLDRSTSSAQQNTLRNRINVNHSTDQFLLKQFQHLSDQVRRDRYELDNVIH